LTIDPNLPIPAKFADSPDWADFNGESQQQLAHFAGRIASVVGAICGEKVRRTLRIDSSLRLFFPHVVFLPRIL
jgi:hypothetical protein